MKLNKVDFLILKKNDIDPSKIVHKIISTNRNIQEYTDSKKMYEYILNNKLFDEVNIPEDFFLMYDKSYFNGFLQDYLSGRETGRNSDEMFEFCKKIALDNKRASHAWTFIIEYYRYKKVFPDFLIKKIISFDGLTCVMLCEDIIEKLSVVPPDEIIEKTIEDHYNKRKFLSYLDHIIGSVSEEKSRLGKDVYDMVKKIINNKENKLINNESFKLYFQKQ
jgi:hypothetical protein